MQIHVVGYCIIYRHVSTLSQSLRKRMKWIGTSVYRIRINKSAHHDIMGNSVQTSNQNEILVWSLRISTQSHLGKYWLCTQKTSRKYISGINKKEEQIDTDAIFDKVDKNVLNLTLFGQLKFTWVFQNSPWSMFYANWDFEMITGLYRSRAGFHNQGFTFSVNPNKVIRF